MARAKTVRSGFFAALVAVLAMSMGCTSIVDGKLAKKPASGADGGQIDGGSSQPDGGQPPTDAGAPQLDAGPTPDSGSGCPVPCDDGNPCNGTETCSGGICRDGTPLAEGAACGTTDGYQCHMNMCLPPPPPCTLNANCACNMRCMLTSHTCGPNPSGNRLPGENCTDPGGSPGTCTVGGMCAP